MKNLIKKILVENNQRLIDDLLDKINLVGYDNLTKYEKSVLGSLSSGDNKFDSIEKDVIEFLNTEYGEFTVEVYTAKTFGSRFIEKGYVFLNDDMDLMMKLVETVNGDKRNVLYISNDMITSLKDFSLGDNLTPLLVTWLNDTYPQFNFNTIDIRLLF